jgi:hypothetical protein
MNDDIKQILMNQSMILFALKTLCEDLTRGTISENVWESAIAGLEGCRVLTNHVVNNASSSGSGPGASNAGE